MKPFGLFSQIVILLVSTLVSASYKRTRGVLWKPKAGKSYELDKFPDEMRYADDPNGRFAWLANVFSAFMTAEDVERAYMILRRLKGWGKYLYTHSSPQNPDLLNKSETIHHEFDKFLLNLRRWEESRKNKCPDMTREMLELARKDSRPINSPCFDVKENPSETRIINDVVERILAANLTDAELIIRNSPFKERLFRIEMVIILLRLIQERRKSCVDLWEDEWNLVPYQKYIIIKTYSDAIRANIPRETSYAVLKGHPVFYPLRDLFPSSINGDAVRMNDAVYDRIALAIGNIPSMERLSLDPSFTERVTKCRKTHGFSQQEKFVTQERFAAPAELSLGASTRFEAPQIKYIEAPVEKPRVIMVPAPIPEPPVVKQPETIYKTVVLERPPEPKPIVETKYVYAQAPPPPPRQPERAVFKQEEPVERAIATDPRKQIVLDTDRICPKPDYRHLIDSGRHYRRGLGYFLEHHNLSPSQVDMFRQLERLVSDLESIIQPYSSR